MLNRDAALAWAKHARAKRCVVCGTRRSQGHHIITQQQLRKQCATLGLDYERYRWDQRNLLPLCDRCHTRHHSRVATVSLAIVLSNTPKVVQMARELDCVWYLSREYPRGGLYGTRKRFAAGS